MKISLAGIKAKVVGKCIGGAAVGMAAMIGMTPMTAFAGGTETECICEVKCTEDKVNEECAICTYDYTYCNGEEAKEEEHWGPLTPDGNMNLVDDYGSIEAGGKQFITVTTKAGNFFYIIIDRDDQGQETVHFLNLVDESDLLALMDDEEVEKYMESTGMVAPTEEEQTPAPTVEEKEPETEEPAEVAEEPEKKPTNVNGIMAIVLVIAIGGIGGFLYFKSTKGKKSAPTGPDPDEDYSEDIDFLDDDDEDYGIDDEDIADDPVDESDSKDEGDDE